MRPPLTDRGRRYVDLVRSLKVRRRLSSLSQQQEAEAAEQLDELWRGMDAKEQDRLERALSRKPEHHRAGC